MNRTISAYAKDLINCQDIVVQDVKFEGAGTDVSRMIIKVRPKRIAEDRCPHCGRKCCRNGGATPGRLWRHCDSNGILVYVMSDTHRIKCPEHGCVVANVPWAYPGSFFTRDFDRTVAAFARELPKTFVAECFRIDWHTVGRCVSRTLNDLEPDRSKRLDGLQNIIVDETSYRKGHKYITVVLNADTREVVWVHLNHGKEIFEKFCKELTEEQRANIKIVAGDGARWIDSCTQAFFPNATRCVDPFHVVTWSLDALDSVRLEAWRNAKAELRQLENEQKKLVAQATKREQTAQGQATQDQAVQEQAALDQTAQEQSNSHSAQDGASAPETSGSSTGNQGDDASSHAKRRKVPVFTPEEQEQLDSLKQRIADSKKNVANYKGSNYALGKAPDNLTETQKAKLEIITKEDGSLYQAYQLKERLRLILKMDIDTGREELASWIADARSSGITAFEELSAKILRHAKNIENFMQTGISSAAIEATNNKIKLALRKAYGFRNAENMIDMVYFVCSNIDVPRAHGGSFPHAYSAKGLYRHSTDDLEQEFIA